MICHNLFLRRILVYVRALAHFVMLPYKKVRTSRPDLRCHASLFSLTQIHKHTCTNLSINPCYHMSIFHLSFFKRHILFHPKIYVYIYLSTPNSPTSYNSSRLSPKNKDSVLYCTSFITSRNPPSSQHHLSFHLYLPIHLQKSLSSFKLDNV